MQVKTATKWLLVLLIFSLIMGCSKDKNPTEPAEENPPEFNMKTIPIPQKMAQSADPNVQLAVSYIAMANSISNYGSYFTPPPKSKTLAKDLEVQNGGTWTRTWTLDSLTITMTVSSTDSQYVWDILVTGTLYGHAYNNWKMIHAERMKDEKSGLMIIYKDNSTEIAAKWTWNIDEQNVFTVTMTFDTPEDGKIEIMLNPDGSGELNYYKWYVDTFVLDLKVKWNVDGSGQWWTYKENGDMRNSDSWS